MRLGALVGLIFAAVAAVPVLAAPRAEHIGTYLWQDAGAGFALEQAKVAKLQADLVLAARQIDLAPGRLRVKRGGGPDGRARRARTVSRSVR